MRSLDILVFFLFLSFLSVAQKGRLGDVIISDEQIINTYTKLTSEVSEGDVTITVQSNSLIGGAFNTPLEGGDLILIYQAQGANMDLNNSSDFGSILSYKSAGNYEFIQVESITGNQIINLDCSVQNNYELDGKVQVVRVPRFNSLLVQSSGLITCSSWNGETGGIIVTEVEGETEILGSIDASEKGFRGGEQENILSDQLGFDYQSAVSSIGGRKGEGIAGYPSLYGRGSSANGGGGGNGEGSGGAGGANAVINISNYLGYGIPNQSTEGASAWNLEVPSILTSNSSGGGRGGYASAENNLNPLTTGPSDVLWSGANRNNSGGLGGRPLVFDDKRLFFGGGGGSGANHLMNAGSGGNGGGIVIIEAFGQVFGSGEVLANGGVGESASFGAGGGGAAGTVLINSRESIEGIQVFAEGGDGGNQISGIVACGPGGGGTGGVIKLSNEINFSVFSGKSGMSNVSIVELFPVNGATDGNTGYVETNLDNFRIEAKTDTVCKNTNVRATGQFSGSLPNSVTVNWYDAVFGGSIIQTGNTISIDGLTNDTTVYYSVCPSSYREPYTFIIDRNAVADAGVDTLTCPATELRLNGSGGNQFFWQPSEFLNEGNVSNPIVNITEPQMFTLTIAALNGCSDQDSVFVDFVEKLPLTVQDGMDIVNVCFGEEQELYVTGANNYVWTGPDIIRNNNTSILTQPSSPLSRYYVTGTNLAGCFGEDSVDVELRDEIIYSISNDTIICGSECVSLTGSVNEGFPNQYSYLWQSDIIGNQLNDCPEESSIYYLEITNSLTSCSIIDSVFVEISDVNYNILKQDLCIGDTTNLVTLSESTVGSFTEIKWLFENGDAYEESDLNLHFPDTGVYPFQITYEDDKECFFLFEDSVVIKPLPVNEIGFDEMDICQEDSIEFTFLNNQLDSAFWFINDQFDDEGITFIFKDETVMEYMVSSIIWSQGCSDTISIIEPFNVNEQSISDFELDINTDTIRPFEEINIVNNSLGNVFNWSFQDESSEELTPIFISEIEGDFCIQLISNNEYNCPDTSEICIPIFDDFELMASTVITPDGDGFNDCIEIQGTQQFTLSLTVFNRWGAVEYLSKDYQNDFCGINQNGEEMQGTYFFVVQANENPEVSTHGTLEIVR